MEDHALVVADCSSALELNHNYTKVLMRRCQAYEAMERYDEALAGRWSMKSRRETEGEGEGEGCFVLAGLD